jgi:LysR family hydrogen peroxide-inducible transcriptional activator
VTLTQLRYVAAVDRSRHFGRAARACHVTQPTLSVQLRKLEEELGCRLFDRSRQPVEPTALGARVARQARVVLRESRRVTDLVQEVEGRVEGELRLGVLPTLAPYLVPLVAGPFAEAYPAASVAVQEVTTDAMLEALASDRLDAGLIATEEDGVALRPLFEESFVAYVNDAHPLAEADEIDPRALDAGEMWLLGEGHCFRDQVLDLCARAGEANARRPLRFESGALETLRVMVDRAGGLTLLPRLATHYMSASERARVRPLAAPAPRRSVRLAQGRPQLKEALVDAYVETIQRVVPPVLSEA